MDRVSCNHSVWSERNADEIMKVGKICQIHDSCNCVRACLCVSVCMHMHVCVFISVGVGELVCDPVVWVLTCQVCV